MKKTLLALLCLAPVAWGQTANHLDRLILPQEGKVHLWSTYDRTGRNLDFFAPGKPANDYFKQQPDGKWVIFDQAGPGVVERIWSAMPPPGGIYFYFDGAEKPRLESPSMYKFFAEGQGEFAYPTAGNFLGGWYSFVPLPFAKHLKIVSANPPGYFQVTWRELAAGPKNQSYSSNSSQWREKPGNSSSINVTLPVKAHSKLDLSNAGGQYINGRVYPVFSGPAILTELRMSIKASSRRPPDPDLGQKMILRLYVDGREQPNVEASVSDFFGDPMGLSEMKSLPIGSTEDGYYCLFPMPFAKHLKIELENQSDFDIDWEIKAACQGKLPQNYLEFFARWHRENPAQDKGKPFTILNAKGKGHFVGVSLTASSGGKGVGFLEGDELFSLDGRPHTDYNGTGMEDYFNGAWYFVMGHMGSGPFFGAPYIAMDEGRVHLYRFHLPDPVNFEQSALLRLEHGTENSVPLDMSCVTYFYATPETQADFAPLPPFEKRRMRDKLGDAGTPLDLQKLRNDHRARQQYYIPQLQGRALVATSKTGTRVSYPIQVPAAGQWNLRSIFGQSPSSGFYYALIDGKRVKGASFDCSVPYPTLAVSGNMPIAEGVELAAGEHLVTVVSEVPKKDPAQLQEIDKKLLGADILLQSMDLEKSNPPRRSPQ